MLIAQITDLHLGFDPGNPDEFNRQRLDATIDQLLAGPDRPDLMLVTGDLTEHGDAQSYEQVAEALSRCPWPIRFALGNHDDRANFAAAFPDAPMAGGFAQQVIALSGFRIVVTDTLEVGRNGGGFCEDRAEWLRAALAGDPDTPTLIALHHPPFKAGIDWMNTMPHEPWVERFGAVIAGQDQVVAIICGHLHRAIVAPWRGMPVAVCASTAPQLALDLRDIDPGAPDGRAMIVADPPGYALHRWDGAQFVTHFATAGDHPVLARYDDKFQPVVQMLVAEQG